MEQTYKIGEAAALLNLKTYVLRFWETEFPQIAPLRTEKGQRLYRAKDIELLERIRYLLHEQGLTIDGARKILDSHEAEAYIPTTPMAASVPTPMPPPLPSPMPPLKKNSDQSVPAATLPQPQTSHSQSLSLNATQAHSAEHAKARGENLQASVQSQGQSMVQAKELGDFSADSSASDNRLAQDVLAERGQVDGRLAAPHSDPHSATDSNTHPDSLLPSGAALQTLITDLEEVAAILRRAPSQGSFIQ